MSRISLCSVSPRHCSSAARLIFIFIKFHESLLCVNSKWQAHIHFDRTPSSAFLPSCARPAGTTRHPNQIHGPSARRAPSDLARRADSRQRPSRLPAPAVSARLIAPTRWARCHVSARCPICTFLYIYISTAPRAALSVHFYIYISTTTPRVRTLALTPDSRPSARHANNLNRNGKAILWRADQR